MRRKISTDTLNATYGSVRLADRLLESLQAVGYDLGRLSAADLITFDELHVMGRQATVELGRSGRPHGCDARSRHRQRPGRIRPHSGR